MFELAVDVDGLNGRLLEHQRHHDDHRVVDFADIGESNHRVHDPAEQRR